jgi:hypothetical protein
LRVKDATAHDVAHMLPAMFLKPLDQSKVAAFKERVKQMNGNDSLKATYCSDLESMSPPNYFPTYMISHGMASYANAVGTALPGSNAGENPLVSPFDVAKAWKQAVDEYLQCKKPERTGRLRGSCYRLHSLYSREANVDRYRELASLMSQIIQRWPEIASYAKIMVDRLVEEIPNSDSRHFWRLQVELRRL